jgi:hypothetical protein
VVAAWAEGDDRRTTGCTVAGTTTRYRPFLEPLEDRALPTATRLVIDFTPDTDVRNQFPGYQPRDFADAFRVRGDSSAVRFLDFNNDGAVDPRTDAALAARAVVRRVEAYFLPFLQLGVSVEGVDDGRQGNRGAVALKRGLASRHVQVFVLYVGGRIGDLGTFGESFQAAVGFNNEDYGRVYSDAIVRHFRHTAPAATPAAFTAYVASTVAHEFGHLLGLGHPSPDFRDAHNVMDSSADGKDDAFLNQTYLADLSRSRDSFVSAVGPQNPYEELRRSFEGQPTQSVPAARTNLLL